MNKTEKELKNYIEGAERMSGMDSYDSYDGESSNFDDDDMEMSSADGYSDASGNAAHTMSEPYIIQYTNTDTTAAHNCVFMGFNDNFNAIAAGGSIASGQGVYGNDLAIGVVNVQTGTVGGYGRLIAQSNSKVFKAGKWRFISDTPANLNLTLQINYVDGNGNATQKPFNITILKDLYQQITNAVDVTKAINFDGNTFLKFTIAAGSTLQLVAFPTTILSGKAVLNGGHQVNNARAPRLSGKNVAPVIIQTGSSVKGITKG